MTEPKKPGLFLRLTPENSPVYDAECGGCFDCRKTYYDYTSESTRFKVSTTNTIEYELETRSMKHGSACHGTGTVRKCVVGEVVRGIVIDSVSGGYVTGLHAWLMYDGKQYCKTEKIYQEPFSSNAYEAFPIYKVIDGLTANIIRDYRAGILPPEIAAGLREVTG